MIVSTLSLILRLSVQTLSLTLIFKWPGTEIGTEHFPGNFSKVTDRTGNMWVVWHSSVKKINCHHFTMVARTCASRVASLPSVDVARSESGELSKDGHRPSSIPPALQFQIVAESGESGELSK